MVERRRPRRLRTTPNVGPGLTAELAVQQRQKAAIDTAVRLGTPLVVRELEAMMEEVRGEEERWFDDDTPDLGEDPDELEDERWIRPRPEQTELEVEPLYLSFQSGQVDFQLVLDDGGVRLESLRGDESGWFNHPDSEDTFIFMLLQHLEDQLSRKREVLETRLERWSGDRLGLLGIIDLAQDMATKDMQGRDVETLRVQISRFVNNARVLLPDGRSFILGYLFQTGGEPNEPLNDAVLEIARRFINEQRGETKVAQVARAVMGSDDAEIKAWLARLDSKDIPNTVRRHIEYRLGNYQQDVLGGLKARDTSELQDEFERFVAERQWKRMGRK